jgi:hypothetical protein
MISYSTNFMGPISMNWFRDRGLTRKVSKVLEEGRKFYPKALGPGDVWEYDEITTHYSGGRIDIRDSSKQGYDGWDEYGVAPMHEEDWNALGDFLWDLETDVQLSYEQLIERFELWHGKEIKWAD